MSREQPIISAQQLWALFFGIQLIVAPFYWRVPATIALTLMLFSFWIVMVALQRTPLPGKWVRTILLVVTLAVMAFSYGTLLGREAGVGFIALLIFLKLFEVSKKQDIYIVLYLNYFLTASNFFYTQNPWTVVYVFIAVIYLTSLLILFSDRLATIVWRQRLRIAARSILQATPLMLVMFVLFPRIPGPLWGLPKDAATAVSGLSDNMSPGSFTSLIQSDEVAFRVRFEGEPPPHEEMYWRGPVFSYYDGRTWSKGFASKKMYPNLRQLDDDSGQLRYTVTLEPHQRHWLFALEYPVQLGYSGYRLSREMQLLYKRKVTNIFQYSLTSDTLAVNRGLFPVERTRNLRLPFNLNPQTVALAERWREQSNGQARGIVGQALSHFRNQPFVYTLEPPALGNDAMDDFLFNTRRGFCEHYSSAFVYLMRAAGVPARVVTGYQGGDKNPFDDYIIIRQSNAHAWAEVWLEDKGWTRVDPTAAVSPDRIESGIQNAIDETSLLPAILVSNNSWMRLIRYQWDSFNNRWNEWVIGFDQNRQARLLRSMGMPTDWGYMVLWMLVIIFVVGGAIAWWIIKQGTGRQTDEVRLAYDRFCRKMAASGCRRFIYEGPQEYYERVKNRLAPACVDETNNILRQYISIRYGSDDSQRSVKTLKRAVGNFRMRRKD